MGDASSISAEQWRELEETWRKVPFLDRKLDAAGIGVGGLDRHTFARLTFTTKEELRSTEWRERTRGGVEPEFLLQSSGTTGQPTVYAWTQGDLDHVGKVTRPLRAMLGLTPDDIGAVWAPIDDLVMGRCMLAEFVADGIQSQVLGAALPVDAARSIRDSGATVAKGLPRAFAALSDLLPAGSSGLRQIHVGGDVMSLPRRGLIERALGCDVYNFYGLSEVYGPLAAECPHKDGMHVVQDDVLIEIVSSLDGSSVAPGGIGVAVFTTLWAKTSPVVRYWSGDLFEELPSSCSCGLSSPRFLCHGRALATRLDGFGPLSQLTIDTVLLEVVPEALDCEVHVRAGHAEMVVWSNASRCWKDLERRLKPVFGGPVRVLDRRPSSTATRRPKAPLITGGGAPGPSGS